MEENFSQQYNAPQYSQYSREYNDGLTPAPSTPRSDMTNAPRKNAFEHQRQQYYSDNDDRSYTYSRSCTPRERPLSIASSTMSGSNYQQHGDGNNYDQNQMPAPSPRGSFTPRIPSASPFAAPGRSIVANNGIASYNEFKEAKRRANNAAMRKTAAFLGSGMEPDIQLSYSPRVVHELVQNNNKRQQVLNGRKAGETSRRQIQRVDEAYSTRRSPRGGYGMKQALGYQASFGQPTSTISPRAYVDRVIGRFNAKPNLGELQVERPMAREDRKREKTVNWSAENFSQDTTHLISPRTFTAPHRSNDEKINAAREVLVKSQERMPATAGSSFAQNEGYNSGKMLSTKDYNARWHDTSKPPLNAYAYKPPTYPGAEYPYTQGQNSSGPMKGRVRLIKAPEHSKSIHYSVLYQK